MMGRPKGSGVRSLEDRLWEKVQKTGGWEWLASKDKVQEIRSWRGAGELLRILFAEYGTHHEALP